MVSHGTTTIARERLREKARPEVTSLLLIGESPPANGTFFYNADSNLYFRTIDGFAQARLITRTPALFLDRFRDLGCFVDDLCRCPVNRLPRGQRRVARDSSVSSLASRLRDVRPQAIVCVMKGIAPAVRRALDVAEAREGKFHAVPFPSHGHQRQYVEQLAAVLSRLDLSSTM